MLLIFHAFLLIGACVAVAYLLVAVFLMFIDWLADVDDDAQRSDDDLF